MNLQTFYRCTNGRCAHRPVGVGRDCGECLCRRVDSHPASDSPVPEWDLFLLKACPPLDPGVVASVGWDESVHAVGLHLVSCSQFLFLASFVMGLFSLV